VEATLGAEVDVVHVHADARVVGHDTDTARERGDLVIHGRGARDLVNLLELRSEQNCGVTRVGHAAEGREDGIQPRRVAVTWIDIERARVSVATPLFVIARPGEIQPVLEGRVAAGPDSTLVFSDELERLR
jgi:hypothetical protein